MWLSAVAAGAAPPRAGGRLPADPLHPEEDAQHVDPAHQLVPGQAHYKRSQHDHSEAQGNSHAALQNHEATAAITVWCSRYTG
jgi:hypothetical protein